MQPQNVVRREPSSAKAGYSRYAGEASRCAMFVRVSMQSLPERVAPAAEQPRASAAQTAVNRPAVALIALRPASVEVLKLRKCRRCPQAAFSLGTPAARRTQRVVPPRGLEARFGSYAREQPVARAPKTLLTC